MQIKQRIFKCSAMQVLLFFLYNILKLFTHHTSFYW